jgi:glutamate synthase domain-containing protein 3
MTNGLVIVLGKTGRNFAAGMSGGIAYVLDEHGDFSGYRCNQTSVDLEQVFDPEDQQTLKNLIHRHFEATGSPRARWVLENWTAMLPKFAKVFPHEFRRVLAKRAAAAAIQVIPAAETRAALHG